MLDLHRYSANDPISYAIMGYAFIGIRYSYHANFFLTWSEMDLSLRALGACALDATDLWCYVRAVSSREEILRHPIEPPQHTSESVAEFLLRRSVRCKVVFLDGLTQALTHERSKDKMVNRDLLVSKIECLLRSICRLKDEILDQQSPQTD